MMTAVACASQIMTTFTTLCDEITELCAIAKARYLAPLALFGRQVDEDEWDSKVCTARGRGLYRCR